MRRKSKKKRTAKSRTVSILLTTLLVSVAFLLGSWAERTEVSFEWIEKYMDQVKMRIRSFHLLFIDERPAGEVAQLHFFDVGQGGSVLLEAYDGTTILIDTGRYDRSGSEIITYLNEEIGVGGEIDLLIFTHNDADHIGNGDMILEYFQVEEVWMNGMDHTSQTYSDVLDAMLEAEVTYSEPKAGEVTDVGPFKIQVLHPAKEKSERTQNDESIVTRIQVDETAIIHSGDVSARVEERIIAEHSGKLKSDIMILGHHGSRTSTSEAWLETVGPSVAVYQSGMDNQYGHPHEETLNKLTERSIAVYGTDIHGTIHFTLKENDQLEINTEEEN